jgi:hypothetical protein
MSDSINAGASGVSRLDTFGRHVAKFLDMDLISLGIGGTGYTVATGVSSFIDRLGDIEKAQPDVLIITGGQNDAASHSVEVYDAATFFIQECRRVVRKPVYIILTGMWQYSTSASFSVTSDVVESALKLAAEEQNCLFVSFIDPDNRYDDSPDWDARAFKAGDFCRAGNYVWRCITAHTGVTEIDLTKFRATSFITGTGSINTPVGDGNADIFRVTNVSGDVHPSKQFHLAFGRYISQRISTWINSL